MNHDDPRWQLAAWGCSIELMPEQAAFLEHPAQLLQWSGGMASGGSTAVLMGAFLAAWRGRALLVCDPDRFRRTMEGTELLALLAPGGIVRARGDLPCPYLGDTFQASPR